MSNTRKEMIAALKQLVVPSKQKFLVCVDNHDVQLVNGCDQNHPQIRLKYQYGLTVWIPTAIFREVLLSALHDYMNTVEAADTKTCFDDEGDGFDYSPELKGLKENYEQLNKGAKL